VVAARAVLVIVATTVSVEALAVAVLAGLIGAHLVLLVQAVKVTQVAMEQCCPVVQLLRRVVAEADIVLLERLELRLRLVAAVRVTHLQSQAHLLLMVVAVVEVAI
jgi:hypothetical protein